MAQRHKDLFGISKLERALPDVLVGFFVLPVAGNELRVASCRL